MIETARERQVREALARVRVSPDPKRHHPACLHRQAVTCTTLVECEHGFDVCPQCDPCTCGYVK